MMIFLTDSYGLMRKMEKNCHASCFAFGKYFGHVRSLYGAGELTSAINRIIEDVNHRFVLEVLTRLFVSHDLWHYNKEFNTRA